MDSSIQSVARGARRNAWRMCFALFVAAASCFLGAADELPEPFPIPWLVLPVLAALLTMRW
jgi:hypothetical protein